jgi:predicted GIY-YIG superfamily endonuclease
MGHVYLIHFDKKLHHALHYIGFCEDGNLDSRFQTHKSGGGAKILRALNQKGIGYNIVRTWKNVDRNFERRLKNYKKSSCFCPKCNKHAQTRGD